MISPPIQSELTALAPVFRYPFEAWLAQARATLPQMSFRVTETRRTYERQAWLHDQGRVPPYLNRPVVTWVMNSKHRYGLAADVAMIRRSTGKAEWEVTSWQWLYQVVPVAPYGLATLAPTEYPHVELLYADHAIRDSARLGLVLT